jgi:hypothetical protein
MRQFAPACVATELRATEDLSSLSVSLLAVDLTDDQRNRVAAGILQAA